ncbi:MAG: hypothetical protein ACE5HX_18505, partial [bacterium]
KRSIVTQQIAELLERLGKYRISHGDLKHSNILVTDNGPMITDLDGMKVHKWIWMYKVRKAKDLANLQIDDALSVPLGQTQGFLRNKQT